MNPCPYCGKFRKRSNEHIFPDWLHRLIPECDLNYSARAGKVHKGAAKVGDVCKVCNNGELSTLDAYVKGLWHDHFSRFVLDGETATLTYDYDLLLRWLLKTCFNSARAERKGVEFILPYVPFIMGQMPRPNGIFLILSLIRPAVIAGKRVLPWPIRCSRVGLQGQELDWGASWAVSLRSFQFLLMIEQEQYDLEQARVFVKSIAKSMPGILLEPDNTTITARTSHFDTLAAYGKHFLAHAAKYEPHVASHNAEQRKKKAMTTFVDFSITGGL